MAACGDAVLRESVVTPSRVLDGPQNLNPDNERFVRTDGMGARLGSPAVGMGGGSPYHATGCSETA